MYTETVKTLERSLKLIETKANFVYSDKNLRLAYQILCKAESVKPGKIIFFNPEKHTGKHFNDFSGGKCLEFKLAIFFYPVKRYRIYIEKDCLWPIYLLHELTHQILMSEMNYSGHGKLFKKLFEGLAKKYDSILLSIIDTQIE